jgi:hypothetical protein
MLWGQTDRHRSEYKSPSTIPFVITIIIIKVGQAKKCKKNKQSGPDVESGSKQARQPKERER